MDLANWTAIRLRKMHTPIKEGLFMAGGKTPHQYLTAEIEALINATCLERQKELLDGLIIDKTPCACGHSRHTKMMVTNCDSCSCQEITEALEEGQK